jgi:flagellum-specific peptidoglycan hydrolase FlgJ
VLGIVSLLLLHGTMDEYGKHRDFLKKIKEVKSQYSPDSFEANVPDDFILTIATAETGNFNFEGADTAKRANNFFGIQAVAKVRAFDNAEDSIKGFLQLMKTGSNYEGVRESIARGDDTLNYFDSLGKYAEKENYTEFLKDVYITKILDFMNPRDDTGKLIFPSKKPMKSQMNNLK